VKSLDKRQVVGWIAVGLSTVIICFWAFWGIIENFHEGWYHETLLQNLGLMFVQYLSPMLIFMGVTLISIFRPRIGSGLHVVFAVVAAWFFHIATNPTTLIIVIALLGIGIIYWFGCPQPRRLAASLAVGLPLITLIISGVEPVLRVSQRLDDGDLEARLVHGNGVSLTWAPDGAGWPRIGSDWENAQQTCLHLSEDGHMVEVEPQHIWRLPTVDEAVHSMARHGQNSGGEWDAEVAQASYNIPPDKESPLWNVHSQVIYWWTATEIDDGHAYMIAYDGVVWSRGKQLQFDSLGFRCVKQ